MGQGAVKGGGDNGGGGSERVFVLSDGLNVADRARVEVADAAGGAPFTAARRQEGRDRAEISVALC